MIIDRFVKAMLVLIAVLLAVNCATNLRSPVDAQAVNAKFGYVHIMAGSVQLPGSAKLANAVVDMRNGNQWAFPDDEHPVYLGRYNCLEMGSGVQNCNLLPE